uniref:Uncharacterized protein n=1 Tax=Muribaculaceae bacterium Z82 TaxID=2304548 RepID=A0A7C9JPG8_9BACT
METMPKRITKAAFKRALVGRESLFLCGGAPALLGVDQVERAHSEGLTLQGEARIGRPSSQGISFVREGGTSSFLGIGKRDDCYVYELEGGCVYCCAETFETLRGETKVSACYYYLPNR